MAQEAKPLSFGATELGGGGQRPEWDLAQAHAPALCWPQTWGEVVGETEVESSGGKAMPTPPHTFRSKHWVSSSEDPATGLSSCSLAHSCPTL